MNQVSFEEIGAVVATFLAPAGLTAGKAVMVSGENTVALCGAGKRFCGVALSVSGGVAGVQIGGAMCVPYSGAALTTGWVELTGDGLGGLKKAGTSDEKGSYLVLSVDTAGTTAVLLV